MRRPKAEGFHSRRQQLEQRAYYLINDIEDMRRKLADLKKQAARIGELAPTVNALMKKACAAKTRVEAKSLAKECIFEASDAIGSYKAVRDWILPEIEKKRKGYLAIRSDFESTGSLVRKHQDVYKDMIGSENAMLKDLQEVSTEHYLNNKRNRFNQLVTKLDKHHSELKRVSNPYKKHVWAKAMIDGAHAARDDAKKAVACAKKLPDEPTNSNKDHRCPSNWNDCGSRCCPPDVPCWNYEAMERAVKAGRCR